MGEGEGKNAAVHSNTYISWTRSKFTFRSLTAIIPSAWVTSSYKPDKYSD
jgi:hypothetical protein